MNQLGRGRSNATCARSSLTVFKTLSSITLSETIDEQNSPTKSALAVTSISTSVL
jgi:hypothetical protein